MKHYSFGKFVSTSILGCLALALMLLASGCDSNNNNRATFVLLRLTGITGSSLSRVQSSGVDNLQLNVNYSSGEFRGEGANVDCVTVEPAGLLGNFNDNDVNSLSVGLQAGATLMQPGDDLFRCAFIGPLEAITFSSVVAKDLSGSSLTVSLEVVEDVPATTTSSSTSTTVAPSTTSSTTSTSQSTTTTSTTTTTMGITTSTTTSTTSTTTSTTSTTTSTNTTTTTLGGGGGGNLFFILNDVREFGALQFNVDFSGANSAVMIGACTSLINGAVFIPNPDNGARTISVGGFDTNPFDPGFTGVADLASCLISVGGPMASDFVVTVVDASAPDGTTYDLASVSVTVEIRGSETTTTSTEPPITTTTITNTTTTTGISTTSTTVAAVPQDLVFRFSDTREFGALQFDVDFSGASSAVMIGACTSIIPGAVFIPNPDNTARTIAVGGFDTNPFDPGFVGPADLASCAITAGSAVAGDFVVTVVDASAPDGTVYVTTSVDVFVELRDTP